jgi:hypothetical protein
MLLVEEASGFACSACDEEEMIELMLMGGIERRNLHSLYLLLHTAKDIKAYSLCIYSHFTAHVHLVSPGDGENARSLVQTQMYIVTSSHGPKKPSQSREEARRLQTLVSLFPAVLASQTNIYTGLGFCLPVCKQAPSAT